MCTKNEPCSICEKYMNGVVCHEDKCPVAIMKAENETLQAERDKWYGEYHHVKFDLKQSKMNENSAHKLAEDYIAKFRLARAEAINDFAEKVKKNRSEIFNTIYSDYHFGEIIDRLAEEMEG